MTTAGRTNDLKTTRYDVVLFDLDDTLSDFGSAQAEAFPALLANFGVVCTSDVMSDYLSTFKRGADPLWRMLERGETTLDTLNVERFRRLIEATDIDLDHEELASEYLQLLATSGRLIDGAIELLDALAGRVRVGLMTNGYAEVQRPRLGHFELAHHFDPIVVSSEIGVAKPSADFFDIALDRCGRPDPSSVLVVGDSLTSDIGGGAAVGLGTCWFNPAGRAAPADGPRVDHVVSRLSEVGELI